MNRQWRKAQQAKWNCLLALFPIPPHTHTCKWTLMLFNVYCMWWPSLNSIGVIKKDSSGVATRWRHMLASIRGGHIPEKKKKRICCYSLSSHPTPILTICRVHTAVPMLMYALVETCWVHTSVPALLSYSTSSRATCWVRTLQKCSPNSNQPKCHIRFLKVIRPSCFSSK